MAESGGRLVVGVDRCGALSGGAGSIDRGIEDLVRAAGRAPEKLLGWLSNGVECATDRGRYLYAVRCPLIMPPTSGRR